MAGVRCFVALTLPSGVLDAVTSAQAHLLADDPSWRGEKWVPRENLHITVQFLGSLSEDDVMVVADRLSRTAAASPRFELRLDAVKAVPGARRATMMWATLSDLSGGFAALARAVADATGDLVSEPEDSRAPTPHITLVRSRTRRPADAAALDRATELLRARRCSMSVGRATFLASRLTKSGARYEVIAEFDLANNGHGAGSR